MPGGGAGAQVGRGPSASLAALPRLPRDCRIAAVTAAERLWCAMAFQCAGGQWRGSRRDAVGQKCQWVGTCETEDVMRGGVCSVTCGSPLRTGLFGQETESPKWTARATGQSHRRWAAGEPCQEVPAPGLPPQPRARPLPLLGGTPLGHTERELEGSGCG